MSVALGKLAQEDPSFRVSTDDESGQTIIAGMGELHLDVLVERMRREFSVDSCVRQFPAQVVIPIRSISGEASANAIAKPSSTSRQGIPVAVSTSRMTFTFSMSISPIEPVFIRAVPTRHYLQPP